MLARTIFFLIATLTFIAPVSAQDRGRSAKVVKDGVSCNEFAQPLKQVIRAVRGSRAMSHHFRRDCFQY